MCIVSSATQLDQMRMRRSDVAGSRPGGGGTCARSRRATDWAIASAEAQSSPLLVDIAYLPISSVGTAAHALRNELQVLNDRRVVRHEDELGQRRERAGAPEKRL